MRMAVCKSVQCREKTGASVLKYSMAEATPWEGAAGATLWEGTAETTPREGAAEVTPPEGEEGRISLGISRVVSISKEMTSLMGER